MILFHLPLAYRRNCLVDGYMTAKVGGFDSSHWVVGRAEGIIYFSKHSPSVSCFVDLIGIDPAISPTHNLIRLYRCMVNDCLNPTSAWIILFANAIPTPTDCVDYATGLGSYPVRWLSPQTLADGRYSTKSDVWTFGICIWEAVTFCDKPYSEFPDDQACLENVIIFTKCLIMGYFDCMDNKIIPAPTAHKDILYLSWFSVVFNIYDYLWPLLILSNSPPQPIHTFINCK